LDDCGLATAVATFATRFNTASLTVASSISTRLPELPAATETAAYRIAAEALTNVTRHADASTAHLALEVDEDRTRRYPPRARSVARRAWRSGRSGGRTLGT
jgi:signal transduction histidine kinase